MRGICQEHQRACHDCANDLGYSDPRTDREDRGQRAPVSTSRCADVAFPVIVAAWRRPVTLAVLCQGRRALAADRRD